jgi:hypothetical protein
MADNMRPADNLFELYRLGQALFQLSRTLNERPLAELTMNDLLGDLANVQRLLAPIISDKLLPLDTCKTTATNLEILVSDLVRGFTSRRDKASTEDKPTEGEKPVGVSPLSDLKEAIQAFEYVFSAEISNASFYFVEQIGAYQTRTLIDNADVVFPKNVRDQLAEDAVIDIRAAGRSLAFELPTAVGFHTCRAVETTLLRYFKELNIPLPEYKNLDRYVEALEEASKEKGIDPKVLAALDQFKDLDRNPIMHPDSHLNMAEAQILFALAQSAISGIVLDIVRRKESVLTTTVSDGVSIPTISEIRASATANTNPSAERSIRQEARRPPAPRSKRA